MGLMNRQAVLEVFANQRWQSSEDHTDQRHQQQRFTSQAGVVLPGSGHNTIEELLWEAYRHNMGVMTMHSVSGLEGLQDGAVAVNSQLDGCLVSELFDAGQIAQVGIRPVDALLAITQHR